MKILIVDDHQVVREGVRRLLSQLPDTKFAEADSPPEALTQYRQMRPDIVILDINLNGGSGIELLRHFKADTHQARVIIFSMHSDVVYANSARKAGAMGYVSKSAPVDELLTAVKRVSAGKYYVDSELAGSIILGNPSPDSSPELSVREAEILRLLGEGKGLTEIASTLGIAYKTVANTLSRIKEKLAIERTGDLIRFVVENKHLNLMPVSSEGEPK
jgi:two-component system, NarL family, invasion response regulator UvrY